MSVEIRGVEQLAKLSAALKQAGATDLQRELSKAIAVEMRPLTTQLKASALDVLPRRGKLNQRVAGSKFRTVKRPSALRFQATHSNYALRLLDRGVVRHPVFGNRSRWVNQTIHPNWWSGPIKQASPDIQRNVQAAMDRIAAKLSKVTR